MFRALFLASLAFSAPLLQDSLLAPATWRDGEVSPGEERRYRIQLAGGRHWRILLQQRGIDLVLEVLVPGASQPVAVNSPTERQGSELLLLRVEEEGLYRIRVRPLGEGGPSGGYRIRVDPAADGTADERSRLAAEAALSEASRLYYEDTAESRRLAIARYMESAALWRKLGERRNEASALFCAAAVHRLLNQHRASLELYRQALLLWKSLGDRPSEAATLNGLGLIHWRLGKPADARRYFQQSYAIRLETEDRYAQAATLSNLCLMSFVQGELRQGLECYQEALGLFRDVGDVATRAAALTNMGRAYDVLGQPEEALDHYQRALDLRQSQGNRIRQAQTLTNMALLHYGLGEPQKALDLYGQALELFEALGARLWTARVLHNIGDTYNSLGEHQRALSFLQRALDIRRQLEDPAGQAHSLRGIGATHVHLGEAGKAIAQCQQALQLEQATEDRRGQGITLHYLALAQLEAGQLDQAEGSLEESLELLRSAGDRVQEARALSLFGRVQERRGQPARALANFAAALGIFRLTDNKAQEAETLSAMAWVEAASGERDQALRHLEPAIAIFESQRGQVINPEVRASFFGARRRAYELRIELLMRGHDADPSSGEDRAALKASEQARARSLLDLLSQMGEQPESGLDPKLLRRLRSAQRLLHAKAERRQKLLARASSTKEAEAAQAELYSALSQFERVQAEVRRQSSRNAELTQPRPLSAVEIQQLLDEETVLLEYALGESRSFLWWVTPRTVTSFQLPARSELEARARKAYQELSVPGAEGKAAAELSRLLLGPVRDRLARQRLVVVADGALHYLPFGALPLQGKGDGDSRSRPLSALHEVVHLPSASALAILRREARRRPPAPNWAAVLADPVFDAEDSRVRPRPGNKSGEAAERRESSFELYRLPSSRREAEAIAALASRPDEVLMALDFQANREMMLDERLGQYRIVHLATHGLIDSVNPALSGLAFSQVDAAGNPRQGMVRLNDIYNLRWRADLVVLSACRTALGREVRGEGMVGLTRGFMHGGASRIVASLWPVPDRSTSQLMARLYQGMAREGLNPSAALRAAQLSISQEKRWRHPHYWAGFVVVGDWR